MLGSVLKIIILVKLSGKICLRALIGRLVGPQSRYTDCSCFQLTERNHGFCRQKRQHKESETYHTNPISSVCVLVWFQTAANLVDRGSMIWNMSPGFDKAFLNVACNSLLGMMGNVLSSQTVWWIGDELNFCSQMVLINTICLCDTQKGNDVYNCFILTFPSRLWDPLSEGTASVLVTFIPPTPSIGAWHIDRSPKNCCMHA